MIETVTQALAEDIGPGDITSQLTVPADRQAEGKFYARANLVVAGIDLLPQIFELRGGVDHLELLKQPGDRATDGELLAVVRGSARRLLECERVALNFMQRLSGVATLAAQYVAAVAGTQTKVLDTRKTTPGLRRLEKAAAAAGGVTNHRMGLYDYVLIKNNHITAAGGVRAALAGTSGATVPVEIEVRTWEELNEALDAGAKRLLLDNLTPAEAKRWVDHIAGRASTEISGGVTLETIRDYAQAGADYISVGAITHSAVAVDLNFRVHLLG
ncbi:MAG: carboxylating nicotinate-nucleotide diphosphorylase [Bryobacteraceae bacterium]|nr:carboxylating nicotinate-nucleotide diphosphorylase [Bryobacteraceae bacterium]